MTLAGGKRWMDEGMDYGDHPRTNHGGTNHGKCRGNPRVMISRLWRWEAKLRWFREISTIAALYSALRAFSEVLGPFFNIALHQVRFRAAAGAGVVGT